MPALLGYLKRVSLFSGGAIVIFLALIAAAPRFWLHIVYGGMYADDSYLIVWWAAIYLVTFFQSPFRFGLRAVEDTLVIFRSQSVVAVWTLIAVYPMIQFFGLAGTMAGMLIATAAQLGLLISGFSKHIKP